MTRTFVAEIIVDHPNLPLSPTIRAVPDVTVRVEPQPITGEETASIMYYVAGSGLDDFDDALSEDPTVDEWRPIMIFPESHIYRVVPSSEAKFTTPKIADLGVRVLSIARAGRGWRFRLQAPDKEALGTYWQYCRDEGVQFELEKVYSSGERALAAESERFAAQLTDRQREVAATVTRMGYYDSDGANAEEVAAELGISPSTLSTHLRRIIAEIFRSLFAENHERGTHDG